MIIRAPTASGKTHYIKTSNAKDVVDGDTIIASTIGWPKTERWWEDPAIAKKTTAANKAALHEFVSEYPEQLVLFNGDVEASDLFGIVMIPETKHLNNAQKRKQSGNVSQPSEPDEILGDREQYRKLMKQFPKVPVFRTFNDAYIAWSKRKQNR